MKRLILLIVVAAPLFGQLAEADRCVFHEGDDLAWAQPGYDDQEWTPSYRANTSTPPTSPYLWERCSFTAPVVLPGEPLSVQIWADTAWTLFVEGHALGSFGDLASGRHPQSSFELRAIPRYLSTPHVAHVAIRYFRRAESLGLPRKPSIGTDASLELRGDQIVARSFQGRWLEVFANSFIFFAGIILLILSGADRARRDTFWLGMLCVGVGLRSGSGYMLLASTPAPTELRQVINWLGTMAACFFPWFCFALQGRSVPKIFRYGVALTLLFWLPVLTQLLMDGNHVIFFQWATFGHPAARTLMYAGVIFLRTAPLIAFWPFWKMRQRDLAPFLLTAIWMTSSVFTYYGQLPWVEDAATTTAARMMEAFGATPAIILFIVFLAARFRRTSEERAQLRLDMKAAAEVQRRLIPEHMEKTPGFQTEAAYIPAKEVGGDFYQILPLDGALLIVVGDVSGKGLDAAMLVAVAIGAIGATESRQPGALLSRLNRALIGKTKGGFVTCACALIQPDGQTRIANAGHIPPYLDGSELQCEAGLPLGVVTGSEYRESEAMLGADGQFTFVSDGVVEAENNHRELFGFGRSREASSKTAAEIAAAAKAWGQNDDITVVTVRRTET